VREKWIRKIKDLSIDEFQLLINKSVHSAFEEISEDILAMASKDYIKSIEKARKEYKEGKTKSFEEVFRS
jgi:hypothetical protein